MATTSGWGIVGFGLVGFFLIFNSSKDGFKVLKFVFFSFRPNRFVCLPVFFINFLCVFSVFQVV